MMLDEVVQSCTLLCYTKTVYNDIIGYPPVHPRSRLHHERAGHAGVSGVPGLSRVPGVGRLFRSESDTTRRTNLMVFIRPTIIRSEADMQALTENRYDYIAGQQRVTSESNSSSLEEIMNMLMVDLPAAEAANDD